jgi:hypothetical protein
MSGKLPTSQSVPKRTTKNSTGIRVGRVITKPTKKLTIGSPTSNLPPPTSVIIGIPEKNLLLDHKNNIIDFPNPTSTPITLVKMGDPSIVDLQTRLANLEMKVPAVGNVDALHGVRIPRITPSSYSGTGNAKSWCKQFQDIMVANAWTDPIAMAMLPTCMAPNSLAYTWYSSVDKSTIDTPEKFFKALQTYFKPDTMATLHSLYTRHQYADEDEKAYLKAMTDIISLMDDPPTPATQALVFVKGLKDDIRPFVASHQHATINAAFQHATSMRAALPSIRAPNNTMHQVHAATYVPPAPAFAVTVPGQVPPLIQPSPPSSESSDNNIVLANTLKQLVTSIQFLKKEMQVMNKNQRANGSGGGRTHASNNNGNGNDRKLCAYCEKGYHPVKNCWTLDGDIKANRVRAGFESYCHPQSKNE